MKSIHPPLYALIAVGSFVLGATFSGGNSHSTEGSAEWLHEPLTAGERPDEGLIEDDSTPDAEFRSGKDSRIAVSLEEPARELVQPEDSQPDVKTKSDEERKRGPILRTKLGDVEVFPADNPWNSRVDHLPVHPRSEQWIRAIGAGTKLHPDFGTVWRGVPNGIPYVVVKSNQPKVPVAFQYADESDAGPYPIPPNPPIEGGPQADPDSDRHILMIDPKKKLLYELFQVLPNGRGGWKAGSGAIFDLSTNRVRPDGWTSADAGGLPIFPGLVRYDEVLAGEIRHALRFTVEKTQRGYIFPARHFASRSSDRSLPPMGLRVRLRKDYDVTRFPRSAQIILTALKRYGMLLADNGGDCFISGAPDSRWVDDELATLKRIKGRDLECVLTGPVKQR
ncbi:MAG: hypothetical protein H8E37_11415 [Planctomycetes bacterium]|nr:hypothetical protein [Planctomycetota bacterium]